MTILTYPLNQKANYIPNPRIELRTQNSYPMWMGTPTQTHTALKTYPHTKYHRAEVTPTPSSYHTNSSNPALMYNNVCIIFCGYSATKIFPAFTFCHPFIMVTLLWWHLSLTPYHLPCVHNWSPCSNYVYCSAVHSPATTRDCALHSRQQHYQLLCSDATVSRFFI
jgi:hypothetical protein